MLTLFSSLSHSSSLLEQALHHTQKATSDRRAPHIGPCVHMAQFIHSSWKSRIVRIRLTDVQPSMWTPMHQTLHSAWEEWDCSLLQHVKRRLTQEYELSRNEDKAIFLDRIMDGAMGWVKWSLWPLSYFVCTKQAWERKHNSTLPV